MNVEKTMTVVFVKSQPEFLCWPYQVVIVIFRRQGYSCIFLKVGPPNEDFFSTTIYDLYFSHQLHVHLLQIT